MGCRYKIQNVLSAALFGMNIIYYRNMSHSVFLVLKMMMSCLEGVVERRKVNRPYFQTGPWSGSLITEILQPRSLWDGARFAGMET